MNIMAQRRYVKQRLKTVRDSLESFWPGLVDAKTVLRARAKRHLTVAEDDQAQAVLRGGYAAWVETEGAAEVIRELLRSYVDWTSDWTPER